jgi:hypothetical protein
MPLIAVVEALVFAVTGCFNSHLSFTIFRSDHKSAAYTSKDFARLAQETRCNLFLSIFFISNSYVL